MTQEQLIEMAKVRKDYDLLALLQGDTPPTNAQMQKHQPLIQQRDFLLQLVEARHHAKLTQADLAKKVGISQSSLARIEAGRVHPNLKTLLKITDSLRLRLTVQPQGN
jgi:DNA-binding XRE family transcriptional regulator